MSEIKLYVVATPIGNLGDMVTRAVECLQSVDLIAAEDTRRTAVLCKHFHIKVPLCAYHDHNEIAQSERLIRLMQEGARVALVSDAGTPVISDPGYRLVSGARAANIGVSVIPGACALVTALAGSGMASDRFLFVGFPPARDKARAHWFEELRNERATLVCYESGHRILACLKTVDAVFGSDRRLCLARELTKTYETWISGSVEEVIDRVHTDSNQTRGEFVLVVEGAPDIGNIEDLEIERHMRILCRELPTRAAAAAAAQILGLPKKRCYEIGVRLAAIRHEQHPDGGRTRES